MADDKDLEIELSDQVKAQMAADPKMAAALREMFAMMRQAHAATKAGQYKTMDDAMEAISGHRPQKYDSTTGEVIASASLDDDLFGAERLELMSAMKVKDDDDAEGD